MQKFLVLFLYPFVCVWWSLRAALCCFLPHKIVRVEARTKENDAGYNIEFCLYCGEEFYYTEWDSRDKGDKHV